MAEAKTYEELKPLVKEEGEGILITHADCEKAWSLKELFPGEEPNYDETLVEMDGDQAATLAGVIFEEVFKTTVDQQSCDEFNLILPEWRGTAKGFHWVISRDGGSFLVDFLVEES